MAESKYEVADGCLIVPLDDGTTGKLPLMGRLPRKRFKEIVRGINDAEDKDDYLADVFRPYIGDVVDSMSFIEFAQLTSAWNAASEEEMGATLGE